MRSRTEHDIQRVPRCKSLGYENFSLLFRKEVCTRFDALVAPELLTQGFMQICLGGSCVGVTIKEHTALKWSVKVFDFCYFLGFGNNVLISRSFFGWLVFLFLFLIGWILFRLDKALLVTPFSWLFGLPFISSGFFIEEVANCFADTIEWKNHCKGWVHLHSSKVFCLNDCVPEYLFAGHVNVVEHKERSARSVFGSIFPEGVLLSNLHFLLYNSKHGLYLCCEMFIVLILKIFQRLFLSHHVL